MVVVDSTGGKTVFPFTLNFKVCFTVQLIRGQEPDFEWPFHYTIKSAKHYGLLVLGSARTHRNRHNSTPVRKHFKEYASAIARKVLAYHKETGHGMLVLVRPENEDWGVSGRRYFGFQLSRMGPKAYFILRDDYTNMLHDAVTLSANLHLEKIGYRPMRKPRKRLTKNFCRWRNYKGLSFAEIKDDSAYIRLDEKYEGSLLDIGILPEVIKHVNKRNCTNLLWRVNTPAQAVEAKLIANGEVYVVRPKEVEVSSF